GIPHDADGPVFREPWQAEPFAMTLALHERGVFSWGEWAAALAAEIKRAQAAGDPDTRDLLFALAQCAGKAGGGQRRDHAGRLASLSRRLGPRLRPHPARPADRVAARRFRLTSSPRRRGPIRRVLSIGCGVWVPGLASLARDDRTQNNPMRSLTA